MGYYFATRGWLEVDPDDYVMAIEAINALTTQLATDDVSASYLSGWSWSQHVVNWTGYIFYGADVQENGVELLRNVLERLHGLPLQIEGFFHAQGEDGTTNFTLLLTESGVAVIHSSPMLPVT